MSVALSLFGQDHAEGVQLRERGVSSESLHHRLLLAVWLSASKATSVLAAIAQQDQCGQRRRIP
jgi:hypothetical protein